MDQNIKQQYELWLASVEAGSPLADELAAMAGDEAQITDAFYRELEFGTGGLRGVIGAGTNRMNIYTVAKASQGLANYVINHYPPEARRIAVSRDSRINSDLFAKVSAGVFAANGIKVYIYPEIMPTPCLSWEVRALKCAAGIMVTASHNPSKYNGYKVYGDDGCQMTTEAAAEVLGEIEKLDIFSGVKRGDFDKLLASGEIEYIADEVYTSFIEEVKRQSVLGGAPVDRSLAIVYTPLNGTGLKPVQRILKETGFTNVTVVSEQAQPDGHFPTCPYPNPEIREAMQLGIEYATRLNADLLLATDPDCDRVGIAVRDGDDYRLLTGNETGILLLDYVCTQRKTLGIMPQDPVLVKTIVTMDLADRIAASYGVRTVNVLTGFKYIGEQIGLLEKQGHADSYIFGFEESYGYLTGSYVRDKDAVNASFMICEMFAWYAAQGMSLIDGLNRIYARYGYCLNTLYSFEFEGQSGFERMQQIMADFHKGVDKFGPKAVKTCLDYSHGLDGLPASDVLKYLLEDNCSVVVRPSGTEPKIKAYISVSAPDRPQAQAIEAQIKAALQDYFK